MRKTSYDVTRLSSDLVGSSLLTDVNTAFLNPVPLLYQSGYLTIKGFDPRFNLYTLGFPNMEVKDGFLNFLLGYYAPVQSDSTNTLISLMSMDVEAGNSLRQIATLTAGRSSEQPAYTHSAIFT